LRREYAAGGDGSWNAAYLRALPRYIDDVTADFGDDLYQRMLLDARVAAEIDNLKAAILEDGVILSPAVDDEAADGYALAVEIRDVAERMLADLETPLDDALWDMLAALALGNRVAEEVYDYGDLGGRTGLMLTAVRPKPRRSLAFVVDPFNRLVGFLAAIPGQANTASTTALVAADSPPPNLLPREKFAVLTHRPVDADPRGTSLLRPVYGPWVKKQQTIREYIKYLAQFASPSIIAFLNQSAQAEWDEETETSTPPAEAMLEKLITFQNGTALVLPYGALVKELFSTGDGAAFLRAIELDNRDITLAITGQALATTEGQHQARAAASVHQDILATRVKQGKLGVARMLRRDMLRPWVQLNWGDAAAPLTPLIGLGTVEEEDVTPRMNAVAAMERAKWFTPSQKPVVDVMLGLPARDPAETALEQERFAAPPVVPEAAPPAPGEEGEEDRP
jgi:hypothetical protein